MSKRTLNISRIRRARRFGFRARAGSKSGIAVLKARRSKGRKRLSVSVR